MDCFEKAELFCVGRNEHLLHLSDCLERQNRYEEIIPILDRMSENNNPFPNRTFLIEDRCYLNTSNFLNEYRERIERKMNEPIIDSDSIFFDFL
jgi:hypothetical protein